MKSQGVVFKSKVDRWLIWMLVISELAVLVAIVLTFAEGGWVERIIGVIVVLSTPALLAIFLPIRYVILDDLLLVRSGMLRWQIPISSIDQVYPTRDPLSAPSLSLDRIRVKYRKGNRKRFILISPEPRQEFLLLLASRDAAFTLEDGRIRRVQEVRNAAK